MVEGRGLLLHLMGVKFNQTSPCHIYTSRCITFFSSSGKIWPLCVHRSLKKLDGERPRPRLKAVFPGKLICTTPIGEVNSGVMRSPRHLICELYT